MKIVKPVILDKYEDADKFEKISESVYMDRSDGSYKLTLWCELGEDEDTQYPMEDLLDEYYVNCTSHIEEIEDDEGEVIGMEVELEGSLRDMEANHKNILAVSALIGGEYITH